MTSIRTNIQAYRLNLDCRGCTELALRGQLSVCKHMPSCGEQLAQHARGLSALVAEFGLDLRTSRPVDPQPPASLKELPGAWGRFCTGAGALKAQSLGFGFQQESGGLFWGVLIWP